MKATSLEELCQQLSTGKATALSALLPSEIQPEVGHFNLFNLAELTLSTREKPVAQYPCRAYYKISLLHGQSQAEYPAKQVAIEQNTLVFATPKEPHYWLPRGPQTGSFCVFTAEFLLPTKSGVLLDELTVFKTGIYPVIQLSDAQAAKAMMIFQNMAEELTSDYIYKYDLLRTYVLELIHMGLKLQPSSILHPAHSAAARLTSLFIELLEQQFPLENPQQQLQLRTAKEYAAHLAVHVNHLNKVLKETTGLTTTEFIGGRLVQEAKALLRQTTWNISEIAHSLGFTDVAHFSNFFKRQTAVAPGVFRV